MRNYILAGALLAALMPISAYSRTLCLTVTDGGIDVMHIKYVGVNSLKKPGSIAQFKGVYNWVGDTVFAPVSEAAVVMADGSVTFQSPMGYVTGANENLAGGTTEGDPYVFTPMDCKLFPVF